MNYVVISKEDIDSVSGKQVLMSFARVPIWKTFKYISWQNDMIPNCYDKQTANHALKKYGNEKEFEIRSFDDVQKEFEQYKITLK